MHPFPIKFTIQTFIILAYFVLIVFSPSVHFINYIEFHDCQRVIQLLLLGLILLDASLTELKKNSIIPIDNTIRIGFLTLLALIIPSATLSAEPRYATIEITIFISLFFLSSFIASLYKKNSKQAIKYITYALWASIALYMISFFTGYITALLVGKKLVWPYPFYGFSNIRLFQQYQLWGLGLVCLPLLAFDLKKSTYLLLYFWLTCWWILLYYAASRGVMLSWLVAMSLTALIYKKLAWPFLNIQLTNAFTGLGAYLLMFKAIPAWLASASATEGATSTTAVVTSTIFRSTTFDRIDLWKASYMMIKNFPLFGVGPMHFYFYTPHGTHPHNSVLQIASEFGLPFTLILCLITVYAFYHWMKKFNAKQIKTDTILNSNLSIILFFTIIANGAYSLVEGVIVMPISQVLMFTFIGLMIGQYNNSNTLPIAMSESSKTKSICNSLFVLAVLILMTWSTMPELVRGLTSQHRVLQSNERAFSLGPNTINPRIWMQQRRVEKE